MNEIQSNFKQYDLDDDDIRILGSEPRRSRRWPVVAVIAALAVAAAVVLWLVLKPEEDAPVADCTPAQEIPSPQKAGCLITDTVLGENSIRIIVPSGTPQLRVGALSPESDSTIVLAAEAAFYRKDNGQISGAYILKGDQLSRGYSSLGYCAIINGKISLGNAKSTSLFEEATETEGYFFRQKPLVDNSKAVYEENSRRNPKHPSWPWPQQPPSVCRSIPQPPSSCASSPPSPLAAHPALLAAPCCSSRWPAPCSASPTMSQCRS